MPGVQRISSTMFRHTPSNYLRWRKKKTSKRFWPTSQKEEEEGPDEALIVQQIKLYYKTFPSCMKSYCLIINQAYTSRMVKPN